MKHKWPKFFYFDSSAVRHRHLLSVGCNDISKTPQRRHFLFKYGCAVVDVTLRVVRKIRRFNYIFITC